MRNLGNKWIRVLFQAAGIALFVVILTRVDLGAIWRSYRHIEPGHVAAALVLPLLLTLIKSGRWQRIVARQNVTVPLPLAFRIYASALYLGLVTPGRIGDFAKSLYLTGQGMSAGKAIFSSLADRLFDIVFLVVAGYVSLLLLPGIFKNQLLMSSVLLGLVVLAVVGLFCRRELLKRFVRAFISRMPHRGIRESLDRVITESIGDFGLLTPRAVGAATLLTILAWACHYSCFILFARGLRIEASLHILIVSVSAAVFVSLLPVSLSGLGTRDLVLILIFRGAGLTREAAVTFSFSFILVYLMQGLVGLLCWMSVPFDSKKAVESRVAGGET